MIKNDVVLGKNVVIHQPDLVNLYGCTIGDGTRIGSFVEVQKNVTIGSNCKISSHSFICEGVLIEEEVFVGHGVMFINDIVPKATTVDGKMQTEDDWKVCPIIVRRGASIGTGAVIMGGVVIGDGAMIGAGAVVKRDVGAFEIVVGVPARVVGDMREK